MLSSACDIDIGTVQLPGPVMCHSLQCDSKKYLTLLSSVRAANQHRVAVRQESPVRRLRPLQLQ
jgi:hypothetical protein